MARTTYYNNYNCRPSYAFIADCSDCTSSGSSSGSSTTFTDVEYFTAGETINPKEVVYIFGDGLVYRANALFFSTSFTIGFSVSGVLSGQLIPVDTRHGKVLNGFSGLINGQRYFLSESYGTISPFAPQNKDSIVYQAGIAKSPTELVFDPKIFVIK